jgi:CubicO group peptidase (beta-lactamase class C family)
MGTFPVLALLAAASVAPAATPPPIDPAAADAAIRAFLAQHEIPAAYVTLLRGEQVLLQRGYASAGAEPDATSKFPIGSTSKQFTAAVILALADDGKLRLDAPVGEYLPEWFAGEPGLRITHLLSQSSGLADFLWLDGYRPLADDPATPIAAYIALAAAEPRRFAPGTRWAYSNTNYKALALIVERVTGQPFDDVLADRVLRPAGIDGIVACHRLAPTQYLPGVNIDGKPVPLDASAAAYVGDGGLCADAQSLAKWIRVAFASRDSRWSRLAHDSVLADGTRVPSGFGLSTREFLGHAMIWHSGNVDSHTTQIAYLPHQDLGIVILTARGYVWLTELMPALIGASAPQRVHEAGATIAGDFEDGLFRFAVSPEGENLQVEIDLIGKFRFVPAGPGEFIAEDLPATFRLRLPVDGPGDRFEFDWADVRSYARRVPP